VDDLFEQERAINMNRKKSLTKAFGAFPAFILLLLILFAQNTYAEIITLKINEKSEIEGDEIHLGEVGDVKGNEPALIEEIEQIVIGSAPVPGKTKKIDKNLILKRLKQQGIPISQIKIIIPENAVATRGTVEIFYKDIEKIVLTFLKERLPQHRSKVKIKPGRVKKNIMLPKGEVTYTVAPPKNTDLLGTIPISVNFAVNGRFVKKVWVNVDIEVLMEVVVTKRPLGRYKLITEDDIHLVEMDLAELPSNVIASCDEVLGKRTRRAIDSNMVLKPDLVELPPLVKRGDIVLIIAESEGVKVTTLGKVKEKGRKGDMVKVVNIDSNKGIYARVIDSSSVKVDF
jgi:flagella basal body P-ring formation protein FlgA